MRAFVLYGLDKTGAPVFTERFIGISFVEVAKIARERLATCARVEVWEKGELIGWWEVKRGGSPRPAARS